MPLLLLATWLIGAIFLCVAVIRRRDAPNTIDDVIVVTAFGVLSMALSLNAALDKWPKYKFEFILSSLTLAIVFFVASSMIVSWGRRSRGVRNPLGLTGIIFGMFFVIQSFFAGAHSRIPDYWYACEERFERTLAKEMQSIWNEDRMLLKPISESASNPPYSWRLELLRRSGADTSAYQFDELWNTDTNLDAVAVAHADEVFTCQNHASFNVTNTNTVYLTGPNTLHDGEQVFRPDEIPDGASHTVLMAEHTATDIGLAEPRDIRIDQERCRVLSADLSLEDRIDAPTAEDRLEYSAWVSSAHPDGAFVMMVDGSTRFLSEEIRPEVLRQLVAIHDADAEW